MIGVALVVYSIATFGVAFVLGHSTITLPIRERIAESHAPLAAVFLALIECPACASWWVGLAVGFIGLLVAPPSYGWWPVALPLVAAFYSAGSSYILARLTGITPKPGA